MGWLLTILAISCQIDFILGKIEADTGVQELLAKSYLAADHDWCYAVLLQFHGTAFETLRHTIPPKQNTLS